MYSTIPYLAKVVAYNCLPGFTCICVCVCVRSAAHKGASASLQAERVGCDPQQFGTGVQPARQGASCRSARHAVAGRGSEVDCEQDVQCKVRALYLVAHTVATCLLAGHYMDVPQVTLTLH